MVQTLGSPANEARLRSLLAELGERCRERRFDAAPNPGVGAAVLSGGQVVAEGFHEYWGGPHAEVHALAAAEASGVPREQWDTLLVTLEPCSSHGKTPPCTEAVLRSGIGRVVIGDLDPDPRHRGAGLERLVEAGVEVELLRAASPLREVAPHFLRWLDVDRVRRPRPWTIAKWAQTRTGQLQPPEDVGEGRWISSPASLAEVHVLRARVDAIVTGIGTVLADDPRLTVRPPGDASRPPMRVVLDPDLRTRPEARLFEPPGDGEGGGVVHVVTRAGADAQRHRALTAAGAEVHLLRPSDDGRPGLRDVQTLLWELGVRRVLLEAGPTLQATMLEEGFVDQVRVYTGAVNGGRGTSLATLLDPSSLEEVLHREVGDDAVLEAFPRSRA